jgi:hypothetical protein
MPETFSDSVSPPQDLTSEDEAHLVQTIKALIEKGEKAKQKADDFFIAAGQHLKTLHDIHKERGGTWAEWKTLVKEKCGIGKSRASALMRISDGRTTVESSRVANAEANKRLRDRRPSPSRDGETRALAALPTIVDEEAFENAVKAEVAARHFDTLVAEVGEERAEHILTAASYINFMKNVELQAEIDALKSKITELEAARASAERPDVTTAAEIVEANFDEFIKAMPRGLREKLERKVRAQKNGGDGDIDPNATITRMLQEAMSCAVAAEDPNTDPDGAVAKSNRASAQKFLRDTERKLRAMGFALPDFVGGIANGAKPKRPPTAANADKTAIAAAADTTTTVH